MTVKRRNDVVLPSWFACLHHKVEGCRSTENELLSMHGISKIGKILNFLDKKLKFEFLLHFYDTLI